LKELEHFDPLAMVRPKSDKDLLVILQEALVELRSVKVHLEELLTRES
jgi:hypothetical protein